MDSHFVVPFRAQCYGYLLETTFLVILKRTRAEQGDDHHMNESKERLNSNPVSL
jgi:hypothetical protein